MDYNYHAVKNIKIIKINNLASIKQSLDNNELQGRII